MYDRDELIRRYRRAVASGRITRRDFIQGMAAAAGAFLGQGGHGVFYPAGLHGSLTPPPGHGPRGSDDRGRSGFPGPNGNPDPVVEACHTVRPVMRGTGDSGSFSDSDPVDYDLIIIGGDLSGLSAAWHYTHLAGADLPEENLRAYEEFA